MQQRSAEDLRLLLDHFTQQIQGDQPIGGAAQTGSNFPRQGTAISSNSQNRQEAHNRWEQRALAAP